MAVGTTDRTAIMSRTATDGAAPAERIGALGAPGDALDACVDAALERRELGRTPPRADREEVRALYAAAW